MFERINQMFQVMPNNQGTSPANTHARQEDLRQRSEITLNIEILFHREHQRVRKAREGVLEINN